MGGAGGGRDCSRLLDSRSNPGQTEGSDAGDRDCEG